MKHWLTAVAQPGIYLNFFCTCGEWSDDIGVLKKHIVDENKKNERQKEKQWLK